MRYAVRKMITQYGMTKAEWRTLRQLRRRPEQVQRFLDDDIAYNIETGGETCYSPRLVLRHGRAHCMEGALLAAAALRAQERPALLLDLESVRDDDHVLALFQEQGCWGALAKSNYSGLRYREPVFRTLRELAMSYFMHYFNLKGERTLRAFSTRPVRLHASIRAAGWPAKKTSGTSPNISARSRTQTCLPPPRSSASRRWTSASSAGLHGTVAH